MSRTIKTNGRSFFRRPATQATRVAEAKALCHLFDQDCAASNRLKCRANVTGCIPTAYDDLHYATKGAWHASSKTSAKRIRYDS